MTRRSRRTPSPAFKAKVAVAAIKGDNTPRGNWGYDLACQGNMRRTVSG